MPSLFSGKMGNSFITAFSRLKNNWIETSLGGRITCNPTHSFTDLMKSLYVSAQLDYPKFYKMDNLCKLAFITSEYLLKDKELKGRYDGDDVGIVLENKSASIDTDSKHAESIKDKSNYFPSPSIFVYTLPNIAIGEICIKNGIKGENALFIFDKFNATFLEGYIKSLLIEEKILCCIGGWIEYSELGYESFMFLVEPENNVEQKDQTIPFNLEEISKLYNKID